MKKAAAYARFSTDKQYETSIETQLSAIKEYCQRKGYQVVEIYIDRGESASSDKRPAFQRMLADARKKLFDVIVVHKLDRFARNRYLAVTITEDLKKYGVKVESASEPISDDDPAGLLVRGILETINEWYLSNLRAEVTSKMRTLAEEGYWMGGIPPYGYKTEKVIVKRGAREETHTKLVINEEEAEIVKEIFHMYASGMNLLQIAKELNRRGIKKRGKEWTAAGVEYILKNLKYTGRMVWGKGTKKLHNIFREDAVIIEDAIPRIISDEIFEKVQQLLKKHGISRSRSYFYLLKGLVKCGVCGRTMYGVKRAVPRYECPLYSKEKGHGSISAKRLESYVEGLIQRAISTVEDYEKLAETLNRRLRQIYEVESKEIEEIHRRLTELKHQEENIANAIANGIDLESLKEKAKEIKQEKEELLKRLSKLHKEYKFVTADDLRKMHTKILEAVKTASTEEKAQAIREVIEEILVFPGGFFEVKLRS